MLLALKSLQECKWTFKRDYFYRQRKRNIIWHPLYAESKKKWYKKKQKQNKKIKNKKKWYKWTYLQNRNRLTDLENKLMLTSGEGWGEGIVREFGIDMYTLLYLKWITNKDLLYSTGNSAEWYVAAWMGGESGGRMDTCIWIAESLCRAPETITTLLISFTPI